MLLLHNFPIKLTGTVVESGRQADRQTEKQEKSRVT